MSGFGATISSEPLIISPDEGQGAKKLKSYKLAGGDIDINDSISGRLISNCIAIQAPKENPATQQPVESYLTLVSNPRRMRRQKARQCRHHTLLTFSHTSKIKS